MCLMPAVAVFVAGSSCFFCGQSQTSYVCVFGAGSWCVWCGQLVWLLRAISVFIAGSRIRPTCACLLPAVSVFDAGS